ncbi:MAG: PilZ domain-containing protein [Bdellovibrionales bacterium]|nr:PilZ domain-containing protein [Bdellovibrionales bacterium]
MGKVIDITDRLKSHNGPGGVVKASAPILDITEARQEIINSERREVKRTILTEFIGAFAVLPEYGLLRVTIYDISDNGVAFDLDPGKGMFPEGQEIAMRVYLNHKTYFPFVVKVNNSRLIPSEEVIRHGTSYVRGTINDVALHHFVKFIETVSANLKTDDGDIQVSNIS